MTDTESKEHTIKILRSAARKFHELLAAQRAQEILEKPMPEKMRAKIAQGVRSKEEIERICADSFEMCVRELHRLGASDVTIIECGPGDIDDGSGDRGAPNNAQDRKSEHYTAVVQFIRKGDHVWYRSRPGVEHAAVVSTAPWQMDSGEWVVDLEQLAGDYQAQTNRTTVRAAACWALAPRET